MRGDVNTDFIPDHYDSLFQKDHTLEKSGSGQQQVLQESVCKACLAVIQSRRITTGEIGLTSRGKFTICTCFFQCFFFKKKIEFFRNVKNGGIFFDYSLI